MIGGQRVGEQKVRFVDVRIDDVNDNKVFDPSADKVHLIGADAKELKPAQVAKQLKQLGIDLKRFEGMPVRPFQLFIKARAAAERAAAQGDTSETERQIALWKRSCERLQIPFDGRVQESTWVLPSTGTSCSPWRSQGHPLRGSTASSKKLQNCQTSRCSASSSASRLR